MIDLRSDTVTKPTPAMLKAMMNAEVGDDVFGEDPSINKLEDKAAEMFGMESGLFCPSGTMTNQIAINVHTRPGDEVICHPYSHIYVYEGGGMAFNSGCQAKFVPGERGLIKAADIEKAIGADDVHAARTGLISLENTMNKGGGACYELTDIMEICKLAEKKYLPLHLDGARLFNALVAKGHEASEFGILFDSVSICLSKGLGCPVGSLLLGDQDFIHEARRVRKKFGGGMRQAGYLAAAGIYALDHHINRLVEDHEKALGLVDALENCQWVKRVEPVETNIVIFYLEDHRNENDFVERLNTQGVQLVTMGEGKLRFVTHLDISMKDIEAVSRILRSL
jgi:threonine aldolase